MSIKNYFISAAICLTSLQANAQVSTNPNKFLGNITTYGNVDAGGGVPAYYKLWNQITCENESKWSSVEGTRGSFNWGSDRAFNYAKQHNFTYKFHALVWGAQYPSWLEKLSAKERFAAMTNWFDKAKAKYKTLPMIDVVNEAVGNHQPGNPMMKETLGGGGKTGYDWLIKAFDMAGERWPDAILIYNDYNSIRWDLDNYITLVQTLRDAGAPIDAYGNQSHELKGITTTELNNNLKKQQDALKMPMFVTEYDISSTNDDEQEKYYKEQIPILWEKPYCAGVTLWGYVYGKTWTDDGKGYSGIYKDGQERSAMTWLKKYMDTDPAKNAVGPFPGTKKEASIYIRPLSLKVAKGDTLPIKVRVSMATKTVEKVDFYVNNVLVSTMTEAPYIVKYITSKTGWNNTKAVVTTTDSSTYERYGRFNVLSSTTKHEPYLETIPQLPGTINITEYDKGASGVAYSNASRNVVATKDGQWMDYTVEVADSGLYSFDAEIASTKTGGMFHLAEYTLDALNYLTEYVEVPKTGNTIEYKTLHGMMQMPLNAGRHVISLMVTKGGFYIKRLTFKPYHQNKDIKVAVSSLSKTSVNEGEKVTIKLSASVANSTIASVVVYANDEPIDTLTEAPYTVEYEPTTKGTYVIKAVAYDANGAENASTTRTLTVKGQRAPYKSVISLPGIIEIENFDKGGEGLSFHDSDTNDEGDANYRSDNEGVDLVKGNGGTAIGYTAKDEWLEYTVNVAETGYYTCVATASSGTTGSGFAITTKKSGSSSSTSLWTISVPQTGNNSWSTYKKIENNTQKRLTAGEQIFRVKITGANCNIDKIEIKSVPTAINEVELSTPDSQQPTYNLSGQKVGDNYRGIVIRNGRKVFGRK